jgi:DNA-binding response OmpR family regulator
MGVEQTAFQGDVMPDGAQRHILVVDDEEQVATLLRNLFEREGFEVTTAGSGAALRAELARTAVNLVTLDLNLGGEDGLALAREIRSRHDVPIIMITAKDNEVDRVVGLELGADDYIVKPFNLREVLARVRAVLRRYEAPLAVKPVMAPSQHERFIFDGWRLDVTARELLHKADGSPVQLTTAEFNLLEIFVRRPARVLSRDMIMDLLKGHDWSPLDRSIDTLVGRLRKKIEPDFEAPTLVKTVRGVGYVFTADVAQEVR